jgi:hypothetical protein
MSSRRGRRPVEPARRRVSLSVRVAPETRSLLVREQRLQRITAGRAVDQAVQAWDRELRGGQEKQK